MKVVNDPRAKWLPSRHRYALSKLIAWAVFRLAHRQSPTGRHIFAIDRDQSTLEIFTVAMIVFLATTADIAALLPLPPWLSIPIAAAATPWLLQIPLYVAGVPFQSEKVTSIAIMGVVVALSVWVATKPTPLHFVPLVFLGILVINGVAWLVVLPLRRRMEKLEQECGA